MYLALIILGAGLIVSLVGIYSALVDIHTEMKLHRPNRKRFEVG